MESMIIPEGLRFKFFAPTVIKSNVANDAWVIRGYAATVDLDRQNDVIAIEALNKAVADLKANTTVFYEHKHDQFPVGRVLDAGVDSKGLWVEVLISKTAKDIWTLIQEGVLNKFSIGGKVVSAIDKMDKSTGQHYNYITNMELFEVSVVGLPANPNAEFSIAAGIRKALNKKETLKTALNIMEGGKQIMEDKSKETIEKATEPKVEEVKKVEPTEEVTVEKKAEEPKAEEAVEKKVEETPAEATLEKKEEPKVEEVIEKKEEVKKEMEEVPAPETVEQPKDDEEELIDLAKEFTDLKTSVAEVKDSLATIMTSIAELKTAIDSLTANKEETMKSIKEAKFDIEQVEGMISKVFDTRVGKIRLVPSRKGTIIKTDLELNGGTEDLDPLVDETQFNKLDAAAKKEVIRKGLVSIIKGN